MFVKMAYLGGALLAGFASAYANDCLAPPSTIMGQLRIVESRYPDGTPIRAFVVFVEEGQCVSIEDVDGDHADVVLRDIHLAPKDDEAARWSGGHPEAHPSKGALHRGRQQPRQARPHERAPSQRSSSKAALRTG
ncbi:hypothetical protein [Pararhizobium sp. O133]|uniref:hypothetical protein n=1 Tax=Pararhizobium sp. O133 TaxID=3449278 RepID=UPI003F6886AF